MKIGEKEFVLGKRTYIMGILNITPDSFSDGGVNSDLEKAVNKAKEMIKDGADIIDIGGESTRPNHEPVSEEEEIKRVLPVLKALKNIEVPISIDTYKANVTEICIKEGAVLINDIWGFKKDLKMASICAKYNTACCLMHNRENTDYENYLDDILKDLKESIKIALDAGVRPEKIIIDPGIGFVKNYEQNIELMGNLEILSELGYPVLLGTSRKRMIGDTLNLPVDERVEGTIATTVIGISKHCDFIRVHDVKENKRACLMADKILRKKV